MIEWFASVERSLIVNLFVPHVVEIEEVHLLGVLDQLFAALLPKTNIARRRRLADGLHHCKILALVRGIEQRGIGCLSEPMRRGVS